jgi:hypothetical protein
MTPVNAGTAAPYFTGAPDRALFVVGNFLLDVWAPQTGSTPAARPSDSDLTTLAGMLRGKSDRRPYPHIPNYLPQAGLIPGSERYVLGPQALAQSFPGAPASADWLGFDKSAEGIVARYHLPGKPKDQEVVLLIALYPTQQIAADKYNGLGKWLALNTEPGQANGRPLVFGTRNASLVALLSGIDSQPEAAQFLSQIQYGSEVTWNEPTHEITDPSIGTMVVGAFFGTGFIMVLAVAAGIGFGGFRLLVKFILPGRVFDRNDQLEILQLGLTSKPIRAGDLYSLK